MTIPWDFGLIDAFKKQLSCPVYPSEPEVKCPPYVIMQFDQYRDQNVFCIKCDFSMNIIDIDRWNNDRFQIAKQILKIVFFRMELYQGDTYIGYANTKINKVESLKSDLILRLTATIYLSTQYVDDDEARNEQ